MIPVTDRIRQSLVSLHMARALETLDQTLSRLERGEISAIEAIDALLAEELNLREGRRIGVALRTARLMPIKTLESFDFSFQPSLDRNRREPSRRHRFKPDGERAGPARVHQTGRGAALPWPARHREKPSRHGHRRGCGGGRAQRLPVQPRRADRSADQGRT